MEEEEKGKRGIEHDFLKINEFQEYLEEDEAREYGITKDSDSKKKKGGLWPCFSLVQLAHFSKGAVELRLFLSSRCFS